MWAARRARALPVAPLRAPLWPCRPRCADNPCVGACGRGLAAHVTAPSRASAGAAATLPDFRVTPAADASRAVRKTELSQSLLYWRLAKGKLTVWVTLSALPGYLLAVPGAIDPVVLTALATGTLMTSSSAQALNQMMEVDRDARMNRTAQRPLPSGRLTQAEARAFAVASATLGMGVLSVGATPTAAAFAGMTMATYVGLYTPMKVISPYNTHIGAISGSLPTTIGFAAALGTGLFASPWAGHAAWLFAMQTLWQMPHFYALAWLHRADYIKGGYCMFPLTDKTGHATAAMSKPYLVAMCVMPWAASGLGLASWMLPVGAAVPSALWWRSLRNFEQKPSPATCRRFFLGSLSYLLATLTLFTAYARAEHPQPASVSMSDKAGSASEEAPSNTTLLEPAWRASICAWFSELCPHEQIRHFLLGVQRNSCPFSRT
mmetsp:Transcript_90541/g.157059  ORF Transcript_90541/g.157059 Transcript_90541/m.157059 type:complete len:434 (+) Transcript_90541:87-1388(+)